MMAEIDGYYVAAQIRLTRQLHKGSFLIVEGDTDARVFGRFVSPDCHIEVGFGKANVIDALDRLEDEGFQGAVGVIDADFDRILGVRYDVENLCVTDLHDFDLTIFLSQALDRYIAEYADPDLLKRHFNSDVNSLRVRLLQASCPIGYCRYVSAQFDLMLYFRDVRYDQYLDEASLHVDFAALHVELIRRSDTRCTVDSLAAHCRGEAGRGHDVGQLANGHDVATVLGVAMRSLIGNKKYQQTWSREVEGALRLAFDWDCFKATKLHDCLRAWEKSNPHFRVLRQ